VPNFAYSAEDASGLPASGQVQAVNEAAAHRQLEAQGMRVIMLERIPATAPAGRLTSSEGHEFVAVVADVSASQVPLAGGLRAAAEECVNPRVAAALRVLATDVERGYSLEGIVRTQGDFLPQHVRGLIAAAAGTRQLNVALNELVEHERALSESRAQIWSAMFYPVIVFAATMLMIVAISLFTVPQFEQLFREFGLELPQSTETLLAISQAVRWLLIGPGAVLLCGAILAAALFAVAVRRGWGRSWLRFLGFSIPLVGRMWQWSLAAGFVRLLAILLEYGVPLPRALEWVGDEAADVAAPDVPTSLAAGTAQGRPLSELLCPVRHLPASAIPFIRWGEHSGRLPEALWTVNDMLLARVKNRALVVQTFGPLAVFVFIAFVVGYVFTALFAPLRTLIESLA
jgi:type II secretory pathway component PulF